MFPFHPPHTLARLALIASIAALFALVTVDTAWSCGPNGGRHRHDNNPGDQNGQPGDDNNGGHHRHHGHQGGGNGGDDGNGPRHRGHRNGPSDWGGSLSGGYGYPGARIGPPTPGCAELAQMRANLSYLFAMRADVESGHRVLAPMGPGGVMSVSRLRHEAENEAMNTGNADAAAARMAKFDANMANMRILSLTAIDRRIGETQDRIGQLEYQCQ